MITLLTDFGSQDGFVGIMKGVIAGIAPAARVVDLSHDIPPQQVQAASFVLWNAIPYFPSGTLFCCVVDPGVGSERDILIARTGRHAFVAPDNGLLDAVWEREAPELLVRVTNAAYMLPDISHTFHGRDIFAPVSAHLHGGVAPADFGTVLPLPTRPPSFIQRIERAGHHQGKVLHIDHFGNLITNVMLSPGLQARVHIGSLELPSMASSYASVAPGEWVLLRGSHGLLEIAARNGNAQNRLGVEAGVSLDLYCESMPG